MPQWPQVGFARGPPQSYRSAILPSDGLRRCRTIASKDAEQNGAQPMADEQNRRIKSMKRRFAALLVIGVWLVSGLALATPTDDNGDPHAVKVSVAYAYTFPNAPPSFIPSPWFGSPSIEFFSGLSSGLLDAGAIRIDNPSEETLKVDKVTVSIGPVSFSLWGSFMISGKQSAILTGFSPAGSSANNSFDTSEADPGPCGSPNSVIPEIDVTVGPNQVTKKFFDKTRVLNTGGEDLFACTGQNEGHNWVEVHGGMDDDSP
jgi:hypothetical protein